MAFKIDGSVVIDDDAEVEADFGASVQANNIVFEEFDNGNSGSEKTIDFGNGQKQTLTLTANNCTLTFTDPESQGNFLLKVKQDATGGHSVMNFPASVKTPAGLNFLFTTDANAIDILSIYYDGSNYFVTQIADFQDISA